MSIPQKAAPAGDTMKRKMGLSPLERIERLSVPEPNSGCWLWVGAVTKGYGMLFVGKPVYAHRVAWSTRHGAVPPKSEIRHICDNSLCVNPDHLIVGTHCDNMKDVALRGRTKKLSRADVTNIRVSAASQYELARQYNVSQSLISMIKSRQRRKHI